MNKTQYIRVDGVLYKRVDAAHPVEDTEGVPLSDVGGNKNKAVQKAIKDSRNLYFKQKGGDPDRPKETGINPDYDGNHPGFNGSGLGADGGDGGGDGAGGGDGGGGGA